MVAIFLLATSLTKTRGIKQRKEKKKSIQYMGQFNYIILINIVRNLSRVLTRY